MTGTGKMHPEYLPFPTQLSEKDIFTATLGLERQPRGKDPHRALQARRNAIRTPDSTRVKDIVDRWEVYIRRENHRKGKAESQRILRDQQLKEDKRLEQRQQGGRPTRKA